MIFNFNIINDSLSLTSDFAAYSGSENYYLCKFNFLSSDWQELSKFAVFTFNDTAVSVPLSGDECTVPSQVLEQSGSFYLGVFGTNASETDFRRISTGLVCLAVGDGAYREGDAPSVPTPDVWEIYLASVQDYVSQAQNSAAQAGDKAIEAEASCSGALAAQVGAEAAKNDAELAYSHIISSLDDYDIPGFMSSVLQKDNTKEYTPSGDFNPATKKYVDDADTATLESAKSYTDDAVASVGLSDEVKADIKSREKSSNKGVPDGYAPLDSYGKLPNSYLHITIPHTTVSGYPVTLTDHAEGENVINYQVYGNSVQDGTPTPETPIEIQSVGNLVTDTSSEYYGKYDIPIAVCGKNWFNKNLYKTASEYTVFDGAPAYRVMPIQLTPNTKYTVSFRRYDWDGLGHGKLMIRAFYTGDNVVIYIAHNTNPASESTTHTYTTGDDGLLYIAAFSADMPSQSDMDFIWEHCDIQIEEGNAATEYEQYSGETKHIYLDAPLRKIGDYADYIDYKNQKVVRNIFKYYLKADNIYTKLDSVVRIGGLCKLVRQKNIYTMLSTMFNYISAAWYIDSENIFHHDLTPFNYYFSIYWSRLGLSYDGTNVYRVDDTEQIPLTDSEIVNIVNEWLDTFPNEDKEIYMILETPTEETITVPEISAPNSEIMNVSTDTATTPSKIDLTYYRDINKVITNLTNAILAQGGNV